MPELNEERASERADVEKYFGIIRRRHLHFLLPLFCTWLLVWGSSWFLQPRYKATALILVEQPTMPENYVAPNVNENLQAHLQSITEQILSRTRLLYVMDKLHLYSDNRGDAEARIGRMRKDIDIELVRDNRNNEITAFKVNYTSPDPQVAQQVASELTDLFIRENLRVRQQQSEGTTQFIEAQLEAARQRLAEQEAKVRAFEALHEGALPSQQNSNLTILGGLQSQLQNEQDTLNTARQQHAYLEALLDQYRTSHGTLRSTEPLPATVVTLDQELNRLHAQLADLSSKYTDQYPDIQRTKDQIVKTQKMRDELLAAAQSKPKDDASNADSAFSTSPIAQVQGQLKSNQVEIENRERAISELKARIGEYQGRLNLQPSTEQELAEMTRGYEQSKATYDELLKKKNESVMATSMEHLEQGERFTILDPPALPTSPDFPNRLKFCGIGLGLGMVVGAIVAAGFEFMDDRLHGEEEIKAILPTAVIADIPQVVIPADEEKGRRKLVLGWALTAAVFLTIVAGAAFSFIHG
jgi:polysaccharide chain length determinant protein (PEP-CTERM system associated)